MRNHFSQWLAGALALLASASASHAQTVIPYNNGDNNVAPIVLVDPLGTVLQAIVGGAEQSGPISGAAGVLTKSGAGILTLTGTNTYTSATHIVAGELFADAPDALANFSDFTVDAGATLRVGDNLGFFPAIGSLAGAGSLIIGDGSVLTLGLNNNDTTFSGIISGLGSLEKTGFGIQTLTGKGSAIGGDLTLCDCGGSGGLTIAGGTFKAGGGVQITESTLAVTLGGVLEQIASPSFGGIFDVDSSAVLVDGAGSRIVASGFTVVQAFTEGASLTIRNGGVFDSRNTAIITSSPGAASSVLVTGAGSTWNVDNDLLLPCGPATLTIADGGLVNSTGDTVIGPDSTLNLGTGGLAGSIITKEIQNDGAIKADFTDTSTLGAIVSGSGTLTKDGASKLILSGKSTYTGNTTVDGGTLSVNGAIGNSAVTVNDSGVLGGNGIVGTTVVNNGGALAPGNSVGTLTVKNSLTFVGGSTYNVEVSSKADRTNVVADVGPGNAALAGGAVMAAFLPTGILQKRYTILNAVGGLGGSVFTGITDNAPGIATSLSYDPNNVYLDNRVVLNQLPGLTINQHNVADALTDHFDRTGTLPLAFATLDPEGLTLASGELATGVMQSGFEASDRFLDVISDRFVFADGAGDGGPAPAAYAGEGASALAADAGVSGAYETLLKKQASHGVAAAFDNRWKVWGAAYGGASDIDGDAAVVGSHDVDTEIFGLAAGAGWRLGDVAFGAALGGGHANFDLDGGLGSGDEGLFNAGVHGRAEFGAAYVLGALAYGYHDVSTSRVVGADTLEASYSAHSFSGRAEAGYRFDTPMVGLAPYLAFQGTSLSIPSYSETASGTGTFALDYDGRTVTSARGELGVRLDRTVMLDGAMLLKLSGRAAWAHSSDNDRSITAGFQALPGTSFTVFGASPDRDSALLDLGAELAWQNGVAAAVSFQGQLSQNSQSYAGFAKLSLKW